jgi:hypothetical protein
MEAGEDGVEFQPKHVVSTCQNGDLTNSNWGFN